MRWARQLEEASCLASAGRVTRVGETTFFACKRFGLTTRDETVGTCEARVFLLSGELRQKQWRLPPR